MNRRFRTTADAAKEIGISRATLQAWIKRGFTFRVLGIEFVSLSESLDTATPAGRMVFTVLGAVAELERSLIVERVKAGLRNVKAKGKRLGRPHVSLDATRIASLRKEGLSWAKIAKRLGIGEGTVRRAVQASAKNPSSGLPVSHCSEAAD